MLANSAPTATSVTGPNMRRERDHQKPEQQRGSEFDGDAVVRLRDHRAGQHALEHLGVDLDAGHGARSTGVVLMSMRPTAEVPISTSLPAILSGATLPSSTSTAET